MSRRRAQVASLVAIVAIFMGFVVTALSLPIDDFWLTIASGRAIAAGADPTLPIDFSWTPHVPGALNPQWGAQVLLGAHGSLVVALVLNSLLIATSLVLTLVRTARRCPPTPTAVALLLVIAALAPHLLARAQSFSLALFAASLLLLELGRGRWWLPPAFALLVAAWANLHGAFPVAIFAVFAWLVGSLVEPRRGAAVYAATLALSLIAILANPVGFDLVAYVVSQPASDVIRSISVEWQPAWPTVPVAVPFWVLLVFVVIGRITRPRAVPTGELLLLAVLAGIAITGIRHIPWFILASAPVIADDVEALLGRSAGLRRGLGTVAPRILASMRPLLIGLAILAAGFQVVRPVLPQAVGRLTPDEPVSLVDRLDRELPAGCCAAVFNEQVWGGYLAYRLADRVETAMDGRIEIRSRDAWSSYFAILHGEDDPAAMLAASGVEWALIRNDRDELIAALDAAGWEVIEQSDQGVLVRAPGS